MPTIPLFVSKMVVSPMNALLFVNAVHLVSLPTVPLPCTARLGAGAMGEKPIAVAPLLTGPGPFAGLKLNPNRRDCGDRVIPSKKRPEDPSKEVELGVLLEPLNVCA